MEVTTDAYILRYMCDRCKEGSMERYNEPHPLDKYEAYSGKIKHKCGKCNWIGFFEKSYPFLYVPDLARD